jgi:hypothetical protein
MLAIRVGLTLIRAAFNQERAGTVQRERDQGDEALPTSWAAGRYGRGVNAHCSVTVPCSAQNVPDILRPRGAIPMRTSGACAAELLPLACESVT